MISCCLAVFVLRRLLRDPHRHTKGISFYSHWRALSPNLSCAKAVQKALACTAGTWLPYPGRSFFCILSAAKKISVCVRISPVLKYVTASLSPPLLSTDTNNWRTPWGSASSAAVMRRFLPHLAPPLPRNTRSSYITPLGGESWAVQMVTQAILLSSYCMQNIL